MFAVEINIIYSDFVAVPISITAVVSLGIFSLVPSYKTMCPEVDSASENEYQGFLLGLRRPAHLADDLQPL